MLPTILRSPTTGPAARLGGSDLLAILVVVTLTAVPAAGAQDRTIRFPDVPGYRTLTVDLHTHSVFSDGSVWPDIRVEEAIRDGLDALAITEHLEYQPHSDDLPHPDRNRAVAIATEAAEGTDLLVLPGSEVTRSMPPGHINAIFVTDANRLLLDDPFEVLREARRQGAYLFWNHPHWIGQSSDGVARLTDLHHQLIEEGLLHGIEVANNEIVSDEALQLALDHGLAILGTSDIHGLVDWQFGIPEGGHRPVTLVLAEERSATSIRDALLAGRTVAWFEELLVGERDHLVPLLDAVLDTGPAAYRVRSKDTSSVLRFALRNESSARLVLRNVGELDLHNTPPVFVLEPHSERVLEVRTLQIRDEVTLRFEVLSALTAPRRHPVVDVVVPVEP